MAASRRALLLPLLAACSIPPESDYVSDGAVTSDVATDVGVPETGVDASPCGDAYAYGGHCYVFYAARSLWASAEKQCNLDGGHLVAINDIGEQQFVADTIVNPNVAIPEAGSDAPNAVWLGGYHDGGAEGGYAWTTGEPFEYSNWASSSPTGKTWVAMYRSFGNTWDDFKDPTTEPFVCEY